MQRAKISATSRSILVLIKGPLDSAVPIINIARNLVARGHRIQTACSSCSEDLLQLLNAEGIEVVTLAPKLLRSGPLVLRKLHEWLLFRFRAGAMLNEWRGDLVYVGSADTAIVLAGLITKQPYVLHLRELHDREPLYMRVLGPIARRAKRVVVPEINRAYIYGCLLGLSRRPSVLPNKTFSHPRERRLDIDFLPPEIRARLAKRKVLLYQGHIHTERDLSPLLTALKSVQEYVLVIMGQDHGPLSGYLEILPELIHIPFVTPPNHLNVTSWAHIGLIAYDTASLNTVYCAPNKIWEYSGFGLPILCSENPALDFTLGKAGAAELVDLEDPTAVLGALRRIEGSYETMSLRATQFFEGTSLTEILDQLIEETT